MNFNMKGMNMELTDSIVGYVQKRLQSLTKIIDLRDDGAHADIQLGRTTRHHHKGDIYRAEINVHVKGETLRAVSEEEDLYVSIDEMKDLILAEVKKQKEKRVVKLRKGGQKIKKIVKGI